MTPEISSGLEVWALTCSTILKSGFLSPESQDTSQSSGHHPKSDPGSYLSWLGRFKRMERAHMAQIPILMPPPAARKSLPPDCTMAAPYQVALVPGEPNRTTTPGVGFAWGGLKMPRQWCFHVGCGFSCVHGRPKGRGSQNLHGHGYTEPRADRRGAPSWS